MPQTLPQITAVHKHPRLSLVRLRLVASGRPFPLASSQLSVSHPCAGVCLCSGALAPEHFLFSRVTSQAGWHILMSHVLPPQSLLQGWWPPGCLVVLSAPPRRCAQLEATPHAGWASGQRDASIPKTSGSHALGTLRFLREGSSKAPGGRGELVAGSHTLPPGVG